MLIEVVCCGPEDCAVALQAGADRIELCASLVSGGLTPSLGTLGQGLARTSMPILCMIRPREGGFRYSPAEVATMVRDARLAREHGAAGVVFGALTETQAIDEEACRRLVEAAGPVETVFHRAFDLTLDPMGALDRLVRLGVTRVLTSGGAPTALEGAPLIRRLVEHAAGRIELLPAGSIRAGNVQEVVRRTGIPRVHLGPRRTVGGATSRSFEGEEVKFGMATALDVEAVLAVRRAVGR
jgi:copper homeostasis protein